MTYGQLLRHSRALLLQNAVSPAPQYSLTTGRKITGPTHVGEGEHVVLPEFSGGPTSLTRLWPGGCDRVLPLLSASPGTVHPTQPWLIL